MEVPCCLDPEAMRMEIVFKKICDELSKPRKFLGCLSVGFPGKPCVWIVSFQCKGLLGARENNYMNTNLHEFIENEFKRRFINVAVKLHFSTSKGQKCYAISITKLNCPHRQDQNFSYDSQKAPLPPMQVYNYPDQSTMGPTKAYAGVKNEY